jgi:hypothetical protein
MTNTHIDHPTEQFFPKMIVLDFPRPYTCSFTGLRQPAGVKLISVSPKTTGSSHYLIKIPAMAQGAPAFKPATKGGLVSPAARPEKKIETQLFGLIVTMALIQLFSWYLDLHTWHLAVLIDTLLYLTWGGGGYIILAQSNE